LRLDFETFQILGPTLTTEATTATAGGTCPDQFKVTVSIGYFCQIMLFLWHHEFFPNTFFPEKLGNSKIMFSGKPHFTNFRKKLIVPFLHFF